MKPRIRSALARIPTYRAGRPAAPGGFKLSSNEVPFPPLPGVLEALAEAAPRIMRYPDFSSTELINAIATTFDVGSDMVAPGTGAVEVLQQLMQIVVDDGDEVVYAWRSFEAYPIFTALVGGRPVEVPLTSGERHDLDAMAAAITPRTRVVLLCSPNNPTGPALHRDELEAFLENVPDDVLVVLDEAYLEFIRDPEAVDGLELVRRWPNVVSLRTFSKAYGLAGLRVGYALAAPPVAEALRKAAVPFGVNSLAQAAAVESLELRAELLQRVDTVVGERTRVTTALREAGHSIPDPQGNFVWLRLGEGTDAFAEACRQQGLMVRAFPGEGVRVTIGEPEANDLFLRMASSRLPAHS